jgi:hypothetical protein
VTESERDARINACRERFQSSGLPLFDEDFSASTNVFNRAAPLLVLIFVGEMLGAIDLDWSVWANIAAALGGLAILLVVGAALNRWRGRPARAMPETVGRAEQVVFVLAPAVLPLIFGGQFRSAIVTAVVNTLILLLVYAVFGYGLLSILRWVAKRLISQLRASLTLLARAVPLLMIFALLTFMSTEMWQVFTLISDVDLAAIALLFIGLGTAFLFALLPREVRKLETEVGTPGAPLQTKQRRNVGLVLFTSQAVQVLLVSLMVAAFFILFGLLAINEAVREAWLGTKPDGCCHEIWSFTIAGEQFQLTAELLKVAGGLAAFTGLYFAIAMLTDATYREEFLEEITTELRSVFRVREEYLQLRGAQPRA